MKSRILLPLICCTFFLYGNQKPTIEELSAQLANSTPDTNRVNLLHDLAFKYSMRNMDSSILFLQEAVDLADRIQFAEGQAKSRYRLSRLFQVKQNIPEQKRLIEKIANLAQNTPGLEHWMGKVYWTYGDFARNEIKYDSAQFYYLKAITHIEKYESTYDTWLLHSELGGLYNSIGQIDRAEKAYLRAIELTEPKGIRKDYGLALYHIMRFYNQNDQLDKYSNYLEVYLRWLEQRPEGLLTNSMHSRMYLFFLPDDDNRKKVEKVSGLMEVHKAKGNYLSYLSTAINVGDLLGKVGETEKQIAVYEEGLSVANEKDFALFEIKFYDELRKAYEQKNDLISAYPYVLKLKHMEDSIDRVKMENNINDLNIKYETAQKEKQIVAQEKALLIQKEKQRIITIGAIASILLAAISFWFLYFRSKKNKELESKNVAIHKALEEKKVLLKEIHHRVKNNLQVISSLLSLQSKYITDPNAIQAINEGRNRVRSMALIHQDLYQKDQLSGIRVREYFDRLVGELFETYRIDEGQIVLKTDIADIQLDIDTIVPVGLIINELVSNVLKYAFPDGRSGVLEVRLFEENNELVLSILDNGIGLKEHQIIENNESFGYRLINAFTAKLDGDLFLDTHNGTNIVIRFKDYKIAA